MPEHDVSGHEADANGFREIYSNLVAQVRAAAPHGAHCSLRDARLADAPNWDTSLRDLLSIEDDAVFVDTCFLHFLDRVPSLADLNAHVALLRNGELNRTMLVQKVHGSPEFQRRDVRMELR